MRTKLKDSENRSWSRFESLLFNLITKDSDKVISGYFSARFDICQAMLDAFDKAIDENNRNRES